MTALFLSCIEYLQAYTTEMEPCYIILRYVVSMDEWS